MPKRIQLSRRRGWRMPAGAVKCDRSTLWGNPYAVGGYYPSTGTIRDAAHAVASYRASTDVNAGWRRHIWEELRGKDLACWCKLGTPCHVDVMLEIANGPEPRIVKSVIKERVRVVMGSISKEACA